MTVPAVHKNLQTELTRIALFGFAGLLLCALLLSLLTTPLNTLLSLIISAALWLLVWQQSNRRLGLNRAEASAPLYPTLGGANRMTITRGWLIAATGGFLAIPTVLVTHPILLWLAAALYSIAAIFDRADGFVARRSKQTTILGAELDTVFDALGLLVAPLLALQHGKIHASYLLVSVAYYLFVVGSRIRENNSKPLYPLPPSLLRRSLAGFQMGYVAVVLWPPFKADVTVLAGFGFMVPLLIGFWIDWLVISGRFKLQQHVLEKLRRITREWILPASRVALALSAWMVVARLSPEPSAPGSVIIGLLALGALLSLLGIAGRAGALLVLLVLAWAVPVPVHAAPLVICLTLSITILLLGCGRWSLWQADDDWVDRRDGA